MKTELFNYHLPKELIAQTPCPTRGDSRLMVLYKDTGKISHKKFDDIVDYLYPNDALIINDTKVIPARVFTIGKKTREILLIKKTAPKSWESFIKPQRGLTIGEKLFFNDDSSSAVVTRRTEDGTYILDFSNELPLSQIGYAPLPPYIKRDYNKKDMHENDKVRYQTVYAKNPGAIAAPTAGMHFTEELLEKLKLKGVTIAPLTLHVGIGTFRPVRTDTITEHNMHPEWYEIPPETAKTIKTAGRIIAVGTTTVRTLETAIEGSGYTNLFIYPPYEFKVVDALITNFHLPKSTLFILVSAFAGRDLITRAYEEAIKEGYRFYSYGDSMLII